MDDQLTPLQRAEALARRRFPGAEISLAYGSLILVADDTVPPSTSVLVFNPRQPKP